MSKANNCIATMIEPELSYAGLGMVILTPALGSFVYGVDLGVTSFVLEMMRDPNVAEDVWWRSISSNNIQQGLFVSSLSLGALIGSHIVLMYLARFIGRRTEIRLSASLYLLGTVLNVMSGTVLKQSSEWVGFSCLILGRLLFGSGVAFIMHGAPIYMSEMCPASIRGSVVTAKEAFIVTGIVIGYAAGNLLSGDPTRWALLYASTALVSIPVLIMSTMIPRSVRWLLMNGKIEEARESMQFVYKTDIDEEFNTLAFQIAETQQASMTGEKKPALFSKSTKKAFTASIGLVVLQQFSGQPSIISYVTVLFSAAGLSGNSSVWTAILMACCATFTVSTVDRVGRKILLKAGCFLMLCAAMALSVSFWGYEANSTDESSYFGPVQRIMILISMFLYIASYQLAYGPITWLVVSELFSLEQRGQASAFLVELNYCLNFLVQFLVPTIQSVIGWGPTFAMFACILAFSITFVESYVPETKGMTLEEIEKKLQHGSSSLSEDTKLSESSTLLRRADSVEKFGSFSYFGEDPLAIASIDV